MGVHTNEDSIKFAAEKLLTPQSEQGEAEAAEQEVLEEETLEAEEGEQEVAEVEEEEVGDTDEVTTPVEESETPETTEVVDEFYSVKVDGEEFEVNLAELKKGYQLEKSYTKKTQALAEEKKEMSSLKQQLEAERDKYLQVNAQIANQANAQLTQAKQQLASIDSNEDPIGYVQKQVEVQKIEEGLKQQVKDYEAASTQQQLENQQRLQQFLVEQDTILNQQLEGWNSPTEGAAIKEGIMKFAKEQGYGDEELSGISKAKDIIVLNKARLYDELMSKKSVVREKRAARKPAPTIRAANSKPANTTKARAVKNKRESFTRSGTVKDAQSLMTDLMLRKPIKK